MNRHIPEDVLLQTLCRLPVKSLLRFRCVSRSWRSMIDDPDFCHMHLNGFENNIRQTHLLFLMHGDFVVRRSDNMETTMTIENIPAYDCSAPNSNFDDFGYPGRWAVVCMMDGVALLSEVWSAKLMLWNPSIRKFHSLPSLPETYDGMQNGCIGLGFDPLTKDFKHIRLVRHGQNGHHTVLVYSVQARLWKVIQFQGEGSSGWHWSYCWYGNPLGFTAICFRGYLCFILNNADLGTIELVSFDLSNEVFASIPIPNDDEVHAVIDTMQLVVINGDCVLVKYDDETTNGAIWVLESPGTEAGFGSMYWKKRCSFCTGVPDLPSLYALKNGDLLLRSFTKVVKYIVETHEARVVLDGGDDADIMEMFDYNESLILLRQG